jgi:surface protein
MQLTNGWTMTSGLTFTSSATPPSGGNLVMTFNTALATTNPGNVYLPLGGTVNATINWGDGNTEPANGANVYSHTYATANTYTVTVTGTVTGYGQTFYLSGENEPLVSVVSWDNDLGLTSLGSAFWEAINLTQVPNTLPANVQFLNSAFSGANIFNQDLNGWDTSNVSGWDQVFFDASAFNGNIASWDTSLASSMTGMFEGASSFNQDIGGWNVSTVTIMTQMFKNAANFNQDISIWNVGNVGNVDQMFQNAASFNQNLSSWFTNVAAQPTDFSLGANTTFANNASNLKPFLSGGIERINT